jgi:hypothetical protein
LKNPSPIDLYMFDKTGVIVIGNSNSKSKRYLC